MKFLLTNDDGIDAPGLAALEAVAVQFGEIRTLAPKVGHSGCSHTVTTNRPLVVTSCAENRLCVDGTPVDCVRLGVANLFPDVDWVLSGINQGANLGTDVYISGTAAAAREAAILGKPAIAISQYRRRDLDIDWTVSANWFTAVLKRILEKPLAAGCFYNVNLPHLDPSAGIPAIVECATDTLPLPANFREEGGTFHYQGIYHLRPRAPGGDVESCFSGKITISVVKLG